MCEQFVACSDRPFRLDELWPFTERLERYGIAGFGWGAAWWCGAGKLESYRDLRAFRDDPGRESVGRTETQAALVHLRRPSKLSTLTPADTQPFEDPHGRFAFSHNGDFRKHRESREVYRAAGRIHGRADSEVGQRWLEDHWASAPGGAPRETDGGLLGLLHETFGGQANLAILAADGSVRHYAGNTENPVFSFRLGEIQLASTAIYSIDRSLFRFVAPDARRRSVIAIGDCFASLGQV
jgi:hypothetical protein